MVLWRDPLEGWYALIALREGSWLRAMDFKLSLTPFLTPGKYLVDAERSGPRVRFAYPGYAGPRSREIVPDTFL